MKRGIFVGAGATVFAVASIWAQTKIVGDVRFYCGLFAGGQLKTAPPEWRAPSKG
jgi:hypothetical protein